MTSAPFTSRTGPIWPVDWLRGGWQAWEDGLDAVLGSGAPVVVLGGEHAPDAELMELSTVAAGTSQRRTSAWLIAKDPQSI